MGGWQVPGYTETAELGRGGTGRVVAAVEVASGERVAIKYLADWLAGEQRFRDAFRAEAAILSGLRLPNVVGVRGYVEWAGGAAIVMDRVDGVSLRAMLQAAGPAGPLAALMVLRGSLLGLAGVHARGIVHRDYKPENVIVDASGTSMLVDFGIALRAGTQHSPAGTPGYMAPEQWAGGQASPASDIYAAAVTYAECLTGVPPPARPPAAAAGQYAVTTPAGIVPGGPVTGGVQPGAGGNRIAALIARATSPSSMDRPATAAQFLTELELAADQQYGPEWPAAGRAALARAAALTVGAAAGAAIGAAGAGQAAPAAAAPVARATTRLGRRAGRKAARAAAKATGKAGLSHGAIAGIGAAAAVTVTVGAVATVVLTRHHSPRADAARPSESALLRASGMPDVTPPVAVPKGYEAAAWDEKGHVTFWKWTTAGGVWRKIGASRYPVLGESFGTPNTKITGARLVGMSNATFIANGQFSGDGTGSFIAFTTGPRGWGTIAPGAQGRLIPTGDKSTDNTTPGNSYTELFRDGDLETSEPGSLPFGPNGEEWQIERTYSWRDGAFQQVSTTQFTARLASPPQTAAVPQFPITECAGVRSGTYKTLGVSATVTFTDPGSSIRPYLPTSVVLHVQGSHGPAGGCHFTVAPDFPVVISAATDAQTVWITAPAWVLTGGTNPDENPQNIRELLSGALLPGEDGLGALEFEDSESSPYYIPKSLAIRQIGQLGPALIVINKSRIAALTLLP